MGVIVFSYLVAVVLMVMAAVLWFYFGDEEHSWWALLSAFGCVIVGQLNEILDVLSVG